MRKCTEIVQQFDDTVILIKNIGIVLVLAIVAFTEFISYWISTKPRSTAQRCPPAPHTSPLSVHGLSDIWVRHGFIPMLYASKLQATSVVYPRSSDAGPKLPVSILQWKKGLIDPRHFNQLTRSRWAGSWETLTPECEMDVLALHHCVSGETPWNIFLVVKQHVCCRQEKWTCWVEIQTDTWRVFFLLTEKLAPSCGENYKPHDLRVPYLLYFQAFVFQPTLQWSSSIELLAIKSFLQVFRPNIHNFQWQ